jgi:REP element-mobilizing transposase RayT
MSGHDYAQGGVYLVTICTQDRACILGDVIDSTMRPSDLGTMVQATWYDTIRVARGVTSAAFQLMPNHLHGLVEIAGTTRGASTSLALFVGGFKTMTMKRYADAVRSEGWSTFKVRLWQRNYHEHLVRNDHARERIIRYIAANPAAWASDPENPTASAPTAG